MNDLRLIWQFLLNLFTDIWSMYSGYFILACSVGLFVMGKLINIIRRVLPHG